MCEADIRVFKQESGPPCRPWRRSDNAPKTMHERHPYYPFDAGYWEGQPLCQMAATAGATVGAAGSTELVRPGVDASRADHDLIAARPITDLAAMVAALAA